MVISVQVSRCAAAALAGFTALSLAGCGSSSPPSTSSSSKQAPTSSSTTASANPTPGAAGQGRDKAFGLVGSVSGGTVTLTGPNGPATVGVSPSTRVIEFASGQLTDVTAGQCIMVRPTKDSSGPSAVTAAAVLVGQAGNGQCGGGHGRWRGVTGTVASVNGNSIVVTAADNGQTTVTATSNTRYVTRTKADTSAIAAGKCLAARGTRDDSGTLQATAVDLRPSQNGQCGKQGG
jgi:Domain of unknown function (DUF5666)